MEKIALIVTVGEETEPIIKRINSLNPDLVYFIHSKKLKKKALFVVKETNLENYRFKRIKNNEDVDNSFMKASECISELKNKDYKVVTDFTSGSKPMAVGLVMASIENECEYTYFTEKELKPNKNINHDNSLDKIAISYFEDGCDLFDEYQYKASLESFQKAYDKVETPKLKKRLQLLIKIVSLYEKWDKLDDEDLENELKSILSDINNNKSLKEYFTHEIPHFYKQMENNLKFLNQRNDLNYLLPDLLNNARRRIAEGKYDDAVSRLYKVLDLTGQLQLLKFKIIDEESWLENNIFRIDKEKLKKRASGKALHEINIWNPTEWKHSNIKYLDKLEFHSNYKMLMILSSDMRNELESTSMNLYSSYKRIKNRIQVRNKSILVRGLIPLSEREASNICKLVSMHIERFDKNIESELENSKFPLFKN